jgi:predicted  nucleic acid-binding Zn-ribbon protein
MTLNDQIYGTNGDSRITGDLGDESRKAEKKIDNLDHQIKENLQRMEAKRKEWEAENARLSRRVLFIVLGLVAAVMVVYWYWA